MITKELTSIQCAFIFGLWISFLFSVERDIYNKYLLGPVSFSSLFTDVCRADDQSRYYKRASYGLQYKANPSANIGAWD